MTDNIRIVGLNKAFAGPDGSPVAAVRDINLEIGTGRLVTLLGPSGCGKTTLLRMIAGFEEPTAGDIFFGARRMNDEPPNRRDTAMVFQSYAVFPHLDVFENVAFGLRLRKLGREELERRVEKVLEQTGLASYARRSPSQLSGGQQQRVALARCIVMEPRVLLFDEPLSNLDAKLREQMRVEIRELQQRVGITSIYVTHDQVEAMSISDEIVVMNAGVVEQVGSPHAIYARPSSRFVADFIGKANFLATTVVNGETVEIAGVRLPVARMPARRPGEAVSAVLRPEAIHLSPDSGLFKGTVRRVMFLGNIAEYLIEVEGAGQWTVDSANPAEAPLHQLGEGVFLTPSRHALHLLP
ncbi:ABC transporter ATP-binding protein [Aquamicrobium soli]|uniref:ABC transporter ATP-binding protein n=1 Tax=Aquamicrobium soli TaxID=1811518 RepID=A0ABV7K7S0_9HYPH